MTESEVYLIIILSYFLLIILIVVIYDLIRKRIESTERKSVEGNLEDMRGFFPSDYEREFLGSRVREARWISIKPIKESRKSKERNEEDIDA